MNDTELMVTLWPTFPHFAMFAQDAKISGIRLNSAMISVADLENDLPLIPNDTKVPLYFDIKGRQLRVTDVHVDMDEGFTTITLNHPIRVRLPTPVLFKAGEDAALMTRLWSDGTMFGDTRTQPDMSLWYEKFAVQQGPKYLVNPGESLHIRDSTLEVGGEQFTPIERAKIEKVKAAGFTRWFLSYVQSKRDVDEFLELVGKDAEVMLKIENKRGLEYVAREFVKRDNLSLVAAKGDLYVELDMPHHVLKAQKLIIEKDPRAVVASRMMLSTIDKREIWENGRFMRNSIVGRDVPSNADFEQLAWLYDIGYRRFMLCDELCLREELLVTASHATLAFLRDYGL